MVRLKHRSREFCELLALLDAQTLVGQPIHLILDPVSSHWSAEVATWLDTHPQRTFVFHFLPRYAPELNPIERIWWVLHEQTTRNHQCQSIEELVDLVFAWLGERQFFRVEDEAYHEPTPLAQAC